MLQCQLFWIFIWFLAVFGGIKSATPIRMSLSRIVAEGFWKVFQIRDPAGVGDVLLSEPGVALEDSLTARLTFLRPLQGPGWLVLKAPVPLF